MKSNRYIRIMPDPVLLETAAPIEVSRLDACRAELRWLARAMWKVADRVTAMGLAAPQVGASVRMFIIELGDAPRYGEGTRITAINPSWEPVADLTSMETAGEQCFSTPGVVVSVPRHKVIAVRWTDLDGEAHAATLYDWDARGWQHECDHLDGLCLYHRLADAERETYLAATERKRQRVRVLDERALVTL